MEKLLAERIKSIALFLLVLCSIFLTHQLWFGRQPEETIAEGGYEPAYFEEVRPLSQMVVPEQVYLCCGREYYRIRPGDLNFTLFWEELSSMLQEIADPGHYHYREDLPGGAEPCLLVQFEPSLPLGPESVWLRSGQRSELVEMQLWRLEERCWASLRESGGNTVLLLLPSGWSAKLVALHDRFVPKEEQLCAQLLPGELRLSAEIVINVAVPTYVPVGVTTMDSLYLKPEQLDHELLLKTFFINYNLVREIKEKDGGLVYTDGEQALRLGDGVDYSHPRLEQKPAGFSYTEALLTAGKLISYHGGWEENLRLEKLSLEERSKGKADNLCKAQWYSYLEGYPLLGSGVSMSYHQRGLQNYRRNLYKLVNRPGMEITVEGYQKALEKAVKMMPVKENDGKLTLEKMKLAYYLVEAEAVPVWLIHLSGRELLLKTGELVPPEGWVP